MPILNNRLQSYWDLLAAALLAVFLANGCASQYLGKTTASATLPDGRTFNYENNRDFQGVDIAYDPVTGKFTLKIDKSGTPEAAIAAVAVAHIKALELIEAAMMKGAGKGISMQPQAAAPTDRSWTGYTIVEPVDDHENLCPSARPCVVNDLIWRNASWVVIDPPRLSVEERFITDCGLDVRRCSRLPYIPERVELR